MPRVQLPAVTPKRKAWNKGRIVGHKRPLLPKQVWAIRARLELANNLCDLALFNVAIDSKLRGCDLVRLSVVDLFKEDRVRERVSVIQSKTKRPVQFETDGKHTGNCPGLGQITRNVGLLVHVSQPLPRSPAYLNPSVWPVSARLTVYTSSADAALDVSRRIHGDAPRAGEGGDRIRTFEGIDAIDMSATGNDMLAHDYFAEDSAALLDLLTLIWRDTAPNRRCGLRAAEVETGTVWLLNPGRCSDRNLLNLAAQLRSDGIESYEAAKIYLNGLAVELSLDKEAKEILLGFFPDPAPE